MQITLVQNRFGNIHGFVGNQKGKLTNTGSNVQLNGKDSNLYWQFQADIEFIKDMLTAEQKEELENGYEIVVEDLWGFI